MAITMQYRITVRCDVCNKTSTRESIGTAPLGGIPIDWIQAQPPGSQETKEFCSVGCLSKWKPDIMPWDEDPTKK